MGIIGPNYTMRGSVQSAGQIETSNTVSIKVNENNAGDIAQAATGTRTHPEPKPLDEPFKMRYDDPT